MSQDLYNTLLGNYISYERLYAMTIPTLYGDRKEAIEVNIFIDLNSFFKRLWDPRGYSYKADNVLAASAINACSHYRNYFWTRHMIKSNIYLVWGHNMPSHLSVSYNAHYRERVASASELRGAQELLNTNLKALEFLCPYLPQVYFINGDENEVAAIIYTLASNSTIPNIVLTKDVYAYQLVAYCPNTFIYRPKKRYIDQVGLVDESWVVMKKNLYKAMKYEMDYKITADAPSHVRYLEYVLALSGLRARHVKGVMTFNRACSTVMSLEEDRPDGLQDIHNFEYTLLFDTPTRCRGLGVGQPGDLVERRNILHVVNTAEILQKTPKYLSMMQNGIQNLYNPQAVMDISNQEFVDYPLELMEL